MQREWGQLVVKIACSRLTMMSTVGAGQPINIGQRHDVLADKTLIERTGGRLKLHHPTPREVVMVHDEPWEGNCRAETRKPHNTTGLDRDAPRTAFRTSRR